MFLTPDRTKKLTALILALLLGSSAMFSCSDDTPVTDKSKEDDIVMESETGKPTYADEIEKIGEYSMTMYVDCNAGTSGDGSESAPFVTLQEANAKIVEMKNSGSLPDGGILVVVKSGTYNLPDGLGLGSDGTYGTAECPIVFAAEEEHGVILTGGTVLDTADCEPLTEEEKAPIIDKEAAEHLVKIDLKKYGKTAENWGDNVYSFGGYHLGSLYDGGTGNSGADYYFGGQQLKLARYPNDEWSLTGRITAYGDKLGTDKPNPEGPTFFVSADVSERMKQWQSIENVWTFGYFMYDWADAANPLESISPDYDKITLGHMTFYGNDANKRYYFFNVYEELDAPGEYYIDRENGVMYFYPPADMESSDFIMSGNASIVGGSLTDFTFKGFTVCATAGNGMNFSGSNVTIEDCKVYGIKGIGLNINGTNMTVKDCEIFGIGDNAIRINGGDNVNLKKSGNLIYNNYIHDCATYVRTRASIDIFGCGTTVSHNEIANNPHMAICWRGAYQTIEYNEAYNICYETSDTGAFYAGRNFTSYGSVVRYNYIHDIGRENTLTIGIYLDDGMSGQEVYGNIIVNTGSFGIMIGGGRDNKVCNNVIITSGEQPIYYDARMRDGEFDRGWYGTIASRGTQFTDLHDICSNEAWSKAFPELSQLVIDSSAVDKDDPLLACNPANSVVKNNMYYRNRTKEKNSFYFFDNAAKKFSTIENNFKREYEMTDFPNYESGDYTMIENSKAKEMIPEFEILPFAEMGRVE